MRCLQFEFDAAQRHLSLRRPAGPLGPRFDERPTMNGFLPMYLSIIIF